VREREKDHRNENGPDDREGIVRPGNFGPREEEERAETSISRREALNAGRRIGTPRSVDNPYMSPNGAVHNIDLLLICHA
jgi:hypothetical protein